MAVVIKTNMHSGTHVDAPLHFVSGGLDVSQIPLDRLHGTALVVDLSHQVEEWTVVTRSMVESALPDQIREDDILIIHYGWHKYSWVGEENNEERYFVRCPGPSVDLVEWIVEKKLKWVGCDCPSFEHPLWTGFRDMRPDLCRAFEERFGAPIEELLPARHMFHSHRRLLARNILHVDNIGGDISEVLGRRVTVGAFPWRFYGGEASICRLVAFAE